MLTLLAAVAVGYLLGAIPSAALAARLRGRRIFEVGSGNMGAMNTARHLGAALGVAVLVVDVGKGAAATALALGLAAAAGSSEQATVIIALGGGAAAVVGHAWSVFVRGRGGKALATIFGAALPLYPWGGLAGLVAILALMGLTRRPDLAAVATLVAYPWLVGLTARLAGAAPEESLVLALGTVPLAAVSLIKHAAAGRRRAGPRTP